MFVTFLLALINYNMLHQKIKNFSDRLNFMLKPLICIDEFIIHYYDEDKKNFKNFRLFDICFNLFLCFI